MDCCNGWNFLQPVVYAGLWKGPKADKQNAGALSHEKEPPDTGVHLLDDDSESVTN